MDWDAEDDNEEWNKPVDNVDCNPEKPVLKQKVNENFKKADHSRVILHIDIDCFYAQVEMIRNPELRNKPLGIQQKYIVVTCNYPARERGVTKLMLIKDAKERCPDLVLVSGEDLTHYREMSYKISGYLQKYCPLVERLGFDENFLDITELVNDRLGKLESHDQPEVKGHVYEPDMIQDTCGCGCHLRLTMGTQVAADIREGLAEELGITCCGGVATNKLLSKLVAGTHKPNQQTALYPEQVPLLMSRLKGVRSIPGIGHTTARRLKELDILTVQQLQTADISILEEEFGQSAAENMRKLSHGVDDTPVAAFGLPQTLSDEDSFKKCSKYSEVKMKIRELITSLLTRLLQDGRTPHTLRLTVRKVTKSFHRESRQCNIPSSMFSKLKQDSLPHVCCQLEPLALGLFTKMVDVKQPFHLTLINVAFAKLEHKAANTITEFFSPKLQKSTHTSADIQLCSDPGAFVEENATSQEQCVTSKEIQHKPIFKDVKAEPKHMLNPSFLEEEDISSVPNRANVFFSSKSQTSSEISSCESVSTTEPKTGLFKWFKKSPSKQCTSTQDECPKILDSDKTFNSQKQIHVSDSVDKISDNSLGFFGNLKRKSSDNNELQLNSKRSKPSISCDENIVIPNDIDLEVFNELPADIQKEILDNAKQSTGRIGAGAKIHKQNSVLERNISDTVKGSPAGPSSYKSNPKKARSYAKQSIGTGPKVHEQNSVLDGTVSDTAPINQEPDVEITHIESNDKDCEDIPSDIDKAVFLSLPPELQTELRGEWKRKTKPATKTETESPNLHFKMPKPSSSNNILSFFPKSNKR